MATPTKGGLGCLMLFGLPFFAVGVGALVWLIWGLVDAARMGSWRETPAVITSLDLEEHRGDDSTTHVIRATYTYTFKGHDYTGDRVAISDTADNVGDYWKDLHRQLQAARDAETAVCYVNPAEPREAVLDRSTRWGMVVFQLVFVFAFGGAGGGMIVGGFIASRRAKQRSTLVRDEGRAAEWKADPQWSGEVIRANGGGAGCIVLVIAIIWNAISAPAAIFGIPEMIRDGEYLPIAIIALFPAVGMALLGVAAYLILRRLKHGRPQLQGAPLPLHQGQRHRLEATGSRLLEAEGPVQAKLVCGQMITTGSGKNRQTREHVFWRHAWTIPAESIQHHPGGWSLPVDLPLPSDAPAMDVEARIAWRLELRVPTRGIDFAATFPLPVVAGGGDLTQEAISGASAEAVATQGDEAVEAVYRAAGLRRNASPTYLRVVSPPLRLRGGIIAAVIGGGIFGGMGAVIGLIIGLDDKDISWLPLGVGMFFGLIGLLVVLGGIRSFLTAMHCEVDRQGILVGTGLITPGRQKRLERHDLAEIRAEEAYQVNGESRQRVVAVSSDGTKQVLTPVVGNPEAAAMVVRDIKAALKMG